MTTTATVTSSPITASVSGASVSASVTSSSTSASAGGGVGPQGPAGAAGATGAQGTPGVAGVAGVAGATGATGSAGAAGPANTLAIGTVTSGSSASATITGSSPSQTLNLVLPKGEAGNDGAAGASGSQGIAGSTGPAGPANSLSIGTVTEGAVGATITGTSPSQVLNLVLPRGNTGQAGAAGATGSQGIQGVAGSTGAAGPANTLSIGTVSSGETAAATITGASPSQTLNLVLPRGDTGSAGVAGATGSVGPQGPAGVAGATGAQGPAASLNYASVANFPATGSSTSLYLAEDTSRIYQWESPVYVEVGTSGGGIATTSASDLTSGTLADARLSANVVLTGDSRLSDSRSPTSHASSHASGGADALTLAASQIGSGTLADARLSSNVVTATALHARLSMPTTAVETFPRMAVSFLVMTSGSALHSFFTPLTTVTVSQITMLSGATAAAGLTLARMGLFTYDESTGTATLVARCASDTTLFTATRTAYTRSFDSSSGGFPATYTLTAGTRYGIALLCVGTTMPTIQGNSGLAEMSALSPRLSAIRNSQSDLSTGTATNAQSQVLYARLS